MPNPERSFEIRPWTGYFASMFCPRTWKLQSRFNHLPGLGKIRRRPHDLVDAGKVQEIVGKFDKAVTFALEFLHAGEGLAFARRLRLGEVLGQELQIQAERAEVILDFVDETAGQFGQFGVSGT